MGRKCLVCGKSMVRCKAGSEVCSDECRIMAGKIVKKRTAQNKHSRKWAKSKEYNILRYNALVSAKGRCQCCGRSPAKHGVALHVDHIKPVSKYPELAMDPGNLQVLCDDCNIGKWNLDKTRWPLAEFVEDAGQKG